MTLYVVVDNSDIKLHYSSFSGSLLAGNLMAVVFR